MIKRWLASDGLAKHVMTLASGTVAAQLLIVAITPILFRLYGQKELDALGAFSALFFTLVGVSALRMEQVIPIAKDKSQAIHILRLSILVALATSLLILIILLILGNGIGGILNLPILALYPWVLPLSLAGGAAYMICTLWFTREQQFKITARTTVAQAIGMAVTQVGGFYVMKGHAQLALVLGLAIGRSSGVVSFLQALRKVDEWRQPWDFAEMRGLFSRYRSFPYYSAPSTLANSAGLQLPLLMLVSNFPLGSTAAFYASTRFLGSPMTLIGAAVAQAYQGQAARYVRENPAALLPLFDRTLRKLGLASLAVCPFGLSAPFWMPAFLGPNAGDAGIWTAMMTPMFCLQLVCSPVSMTAQLLEKLQGQLALDILRVVLTAACFGLAAHYGSTATIAVGCYSGSMIVVYLASLVFYRKCAASASGADQASQS